MLVKLSNSDKFAQLDDADYTDDIKKYKWRIDPNGYAIRSKRTLAGPRHWYLHYDVLGTIPKKGYYADHINGDTLDNRRNNLRTVTPTQNNLNRKSRPNTSSIYKCVTWNKASKKWQVSVNYKYYGLFNDEYEAAIRADEVQSKLYGEYARLNFPRKEFK